MSDQERFYFDMREEWLVRLAAINTAQHFIYSAFYYLDHDAYGIAYLNALKQAAGRGVRVYLLADSFATKLARIMSPESQYHALMQAFHALKDAGVHFHHYRANGVVRRLLGSGSHVKFQITDRGETLLSSGNITAHSYEKWQDLSLYIPCGMAAPVLEACAGYFPHKDVSEDVRWLNAQNTKTHHRLLFHDPNADCTFTQLLTGNYQNTITSHTVAMIDAAKQSLSLSSFYFKPTPIILNALLRAAARGLNISLVHSHISALGCSDYPWMPCVKPLRALLRYPNVEIFEDKGGQHSKYLLADDARLLIGSYNFEHAAHDILSELMLETVDASRIQDIKAFHREQICKPNVSKLDSAVLERSYRGVRQRYLLVRPFLRFM